MRCLDKHEIIYRSHKNDEKCYILQACILHSEVFIDEIPLRKFNSCSGAGFSPHIGRPQIFCDFFELCSDKPMINQSHRRYCFVKVQTRNRWAEIVALNPPLRVNLPFFATQISSWNVEPARGGGTATGREKGREDMHEGRREGGWTKGA